MMQAQLLIQMLEAMTVLVGQLVPGATDTVKAAVALENIAGAVAKQYQVTTGAPIDPSAFTYEAPLEATP